MSVIENRMKLAKTILKELAKGPHRYTELLRETITECRTPYRFNYIFYWLKKKGYVTKGEGRQEPYSITEKGEELLKII